MVFGRLNSSWPRFPPGTSSCSRNSVLQKNVSATFFSVGMWLVISLNKFLRIPFLPQINHILDYTSFPFLEDAGKMISQSWCLSHLFRISSQLCSFLRPTHRKVMQLVILTPKFPFSLCVVLWCLNLFQWECTHVVLA